MSFAWLTVAARRVVRASGLTGTPGEPQLAWIATALAAPAVRAYHLARGWLRFRRPSG